MKKTLLAALAALLLCGAGQAPATIRLVLIPIEPASLAYYAKDQGFFAKEGLNVEISQNPSSPAAVSAVLAGSYDVAYATVPTIATAHSKGLPLVFIAPGCAESATHFEGGIVVGMGSSAKTGKDFNGKTLGTAGLNTIAEYLPRAWIDKTGGDSATVKFVEMPFPVTPEAIGSGRVDGAYLAEPFFSITERKKLGKMVATGADAISPGQFLDTGWFATSRWARANPDAVARFARAMSEAAAWANANPAKVVPILAKELHADPALLAQSHRAYFPERLVASEVQPYVDVTARYAKFPTFKADEIIYVPPR